MSTAADFFLPTENHGEQQVLRKDEELLWYRIKDTLASAGFSHCYLCDDLNLGRQVTLLEYAPNQLAHRKINQRIYPHSSTHLEGYNQGLERFIAAAENLVGVNDPHVERVFDVFEANNTAYAVLAYQRRGETLAALLEREGTLTEAKLLRLLFPLLNGMEKLMEKGLCHLKLEPANILLRKDGKPILSSVHIINQAILGELNILPVKTEILRVGAILYRAVTGVYPPEESVRFEAHLRQGSDPYVPALQAVNKGYSQRLLKAIDRALRLAPDERPESVAEWRQAFEFRDAGKDWSIAEFFKDTAEEPVKTEEPRVAADIQAPVLNSNLAVNIDSAAVFDNQPLSVEAPATAWTITPWSRHKHKLTYLTLAILACAGLYALTATVIALFSTDYTALSRPSTFHETDNLSNSPGDKNAAARGGEATLQNPTDLPVEPLIPSHDKRHQIQRLLELATLDIKAYRLTMPEKNNALEKYQQVLALEPDNPDAKQGINLLAKKYIELASREVRLKRLNYAVHYLEKAVSLNPEGEDVRQLLAALRAEYVSSR
jgi:serine/threonine protein kinase